MSHKSSPREPSVSSGTATITSANTPMLLGAPAGGNIPGALMSSIPANLSQSSPAVPVQTTNNNALIRSSSASKSHRQSSPKTPPQFPSLPFSDNFRTALSPVKQQLPFSNIMSDGKPGGIIKIAEAGQVLYSTVQDESEQMLLQAARNGHVVIVRDLLQAREEGRVNFNINCKGRVKLFPGWTPLHLACYFGHKDVAEALIEYSADINVVNQSGDTPLHKAAYTGRMSIVLLLLKHHADVIATNSEKQTPRDLTINADIKKVLEGAEKADVTKAEEEFIEAAREGDLESLRNLLSSPHPPQITCIDGKGNNALHCAAYRGQKVAVVYLLENGMDPNAVNKKGQTAKDLAASEEMKQLLNVRPFSELTTLVPRFEGPLLKRTKLFRWEQTWAVLEQGTLTLYSKRENAAMKVRIKGCKLLQDAKILPMDIKPCSFMVYFLDQTQYRLAVPPGVDDRLIRQKWINVFVDHIHYSGHVGPVAKLRNSNDTSTVCPLGSLKDALWAAQANQQLLEQHITALSTTTKDLPATAVPGWGEAMECLKNIEKSSQVVTSCLRHCLDVIVQQEEFRSKQVSNLEERCRVLEHSVNVLSQDAVEREVDKSQNTTEYCSPKSGWSSTSLLSTNTIQTPHAYGPSLMSIGIKMTDTHHREPPNEIVHTRTIPLHYFPRFF